MFLRDHFVLLVIQVCRKLYLNNNNIGIFFIPEIVVMLCQNSIQGQFKTLEIIFFV